MLDAGTTMRWTGSWLTRLHDCPAARRRGPAGVARLGADRGAARPPPDRRLRSVHTPAPRYVGIDLIVTVCATPWALRGEVEAGVLAELGADGGPTEGRRSSRRTSSGPAAAGAQRARGRGPACGGVAGVVGICYRRRGLVPEFVADAGDRLVGRDEIIRVAQRPEPARARLAAARGGGRQVSCAPVTARAATRSARERPTRAVADQQPERAAGDRVPRRRLRLVPARARAPPRRRDAS